jgi:hypothetical protein
MIVLTPQKKRKLLIIVSVLVILGIFGGLFAWYKFFREVPQEAWRTSTPDMRFMYGSIGGEYDAGIPYWIFYVLPRVFPEKLPGPGGYASFGLCWEEGREMPIGFTKRTIGFDRVANTCAVCHTTSYRKSVYEPPTFVATGPNHTFNLEAFFRFVVDCAKDPRFNSDVLMNEINQAAKLSYVDRAIYRFLLIPIARKRLLEREKQLAWVYHPGFPEWGRGRDDAMNLTRYLLTDSPMDNGIGPTDMPSVWNLKKYHKGTRMNLAGDSHDAHSVIIDSALGLLGAKPHDKEDFLGQVKWLEEYLGNKKAPPFPAGMAAGDPYYLDPGQVASGKTVFDAHCASCHASARTGTVVPVGEVGTDPERLGSWNKEAAIKANKAVKAFGIDRPGLVEENPTGYIASFLDGIWLRAPYLHNGSVPTLRDLLTPAASRPKVFYRGYDLYDPLNVGFVAQGPEAQRLGTKFDVALRACGNGGHEYGVSLAAGEKDALLAYLKSL